MQVIKKTLRVEEAAFTAQKKTGLEAKQMQYNDDLWSFC